MLKICHLNSSYLCYDTRFFDKECISLAKTEYDIITIIANVKGDEIKAGANLKNAVKDNSRKAQLIKSHKKVLKKAIENPEIKVLFQADNKIQANFDRILLLSDLAHSLVASFRGLKIRSFTEISIFSFHSVKNVTTTEGSDNYSSKISLFTFYDITH